LQTVLSETEYTEFRRTHNDSELAYLKFRFAECPVKTTLGVLGKKWTMLILRDIGVYKKERFNRLLESIPGITPRVLATRLKELERAGLIRIVEKRNSPMVVRWALTEKGVDAIPILMMIVPSAQSMTLKRCLMTRDLENLASFSVGKQWTWSDYFSKVIWMSHSS